MSHFLNTLMQITRSDSAEVFTGLGRHIRWQLRKALRLFPCEIRISRSVMVIDEPGGVATLVNAMGEYDFNNMSLLRLVLSTENGTFVDIGANIGSYSLIASEIADAKVISIEPHPRTFSGLLANIRRNGRENVICLNLAMSRQEEVLKLTDFAESSINRIVSTRDVQARTMLVQARPFHTVCEELAITPDLVKIDVEGHELEVLGGFGSWASRAKVIFIEGGDRPDIRRWMEATGYSGPWFAHFKQKLLSTKRQRRPEDPLFVQKDFFSELDRMNFAVSQGAV
jgi:FkbM family methyltransferase